MSDSEKVVLVVVETERRRVSLGRLGRHTRYLVTEHHDGTLVFEPAVVERA